MTVATMDANWFEHEPNCGKDWRDGLKEVSDCLFGLVNDDRYDLPEWFRSVCERTSVYVLDPVIDILFGRFPTVWKRWLRHDAGK